MDPTEFRQRFVDWKAGKKVYDAGKPIPKYDGGDNPWIPKGTKVPTENGKEVVVSAQPKTTAVSKQRHSIDDNLTEQQRGQAYLRHLYNVDKPLSGEDPIGEFAVEGAALGPVFKGLGWVGKQVVKQATPYIGRALKPVTNWFAAKALSNSIDDAVGKTTGLPEPMFNASLPNIPDVYHNVYYLPNDFKIKGNFVNRIMSIPEMAKYGDLYAAEKEASDFLVKDVAKRFGRNSPQNATGMTKYIYNGSSGIPSDLKIFYADYSKTPYGGMQLQNAAGVPYITVDPQWGNTSRVLTHELEHYLTALRESGINNSILQPSAEMDKQLLKDWSQLVNNAKTKEAYSDITPVGKTVAQLLEDGYKFDDKPEFLPGMINRLKERAATNREIRQRISQENGNVYFEDLDKVIDGLTDDQLLDLLQTENGYSRSFFRELQNMGTTAASGVLKNMREALKYSPAVIPFAIGANTLQEHDKGKSIHINPANKGKFKKNIKIPK